MFVVSDDSWQCNNAAQDGWATGDFTGDWSAAAYTTYVRCHVFLLPNLLCYILISGYFGQQLLHFLALSSVTS